MQAIRPTLVRRAGGSPPPISVDASKWTTITREIDRLGLTFELEAQYDLDCLDIATRRVQVRENEHVAPQETVKRFAVQMGHSEFPPIIVTKDAWLVDGNTRVEAKRSRKEKFHPAFILDIEYATATGHQLNVLNILGATLNASNGMPLTPKERRRSVEAMVNEGWKGEQIARALGVNQGIITKVKRELDAQAKMQRLRVPVNGWAHAAGLRALGTPEVLALNDKPYHDLAELAKDAGLNFNEIRDLAKEMRETGSDDGALRVVDDKRTEMRDRIRINQLTGVSRPPHSAIMRSRLTYVTNFVGREAELLERNEDVVERHLNLIETAIGVLNRVKELQTQ